MGKKNFDEVPDMYPEIGDDRLTDMLIETGERILREKKEKEKKAKGNDKARKTTDRDIGREGKKA